MVLLAKWKKKLEDKGLWEIFSYLFFGGATTAVNIAIFSGLHYGLGMKLVTANSIAWFFSVLFAFVTNKLWVFQTKSASLQYLIWEFGKFVFYRILSLGLDNGSLILFVDLFKWPVFLGKLLSQIVVVVANYAFSKLFIFKKQA